MVRIFYLLLVLYLVVGLFMFYKYYINMKAEFENNYIPKKFKKDNFKKRVELSISYVHKEDEKKMFRMGMEMEEIFYRIFYWPFM